VDPVPDPLISRKPGSAGNRTRDLWVSSQEVWTLDHRGGRECTSLPLILPRLSQLCQNGGVHECIDVPSSVILFTMMMEVICSSASSVLTRATRCHILEDRDLDSRVVFGKKKIPSVRFFAVVMQQPVLLLSKFRAHFYAVTLKHGSSMQSWPFLLPGWMSKRVMSTRLSLLSTCVVFFGNFHAFIPKHHRSRQI
jgi:hypothetical protein